MHLNYVSTSSAKTERFLNDILFNSILFSLYEHITKGSASGATLSLALRSKGEGGQPSYLIIQEVAVYFRYRPQPPHKP
jgi:hypothetical protein